MSIIQVYGPGCAKCKKVEETVRTVVSEVGTGFVVEKVTDIQEIMALSILSTPAIVVDGVIKSSGRIPEPGEIRHWLLK